MYVGTKTGRFGFDDLDFTPERIRSSVDNSLRLLGTDYLDVLQLHDIEFVPWDGIREAAYEELADLKKQGKARYIGMSGYPIAAMTRVARQTDIDVMLVHNLGNLLDSTVSELIPVAEEEGVGILNAAAVCLGLLTPGGSNALIEHPAGPEMHAAAQRMVALCKQVGADIGRLANQYAIQRSGCATTVVGTAKPHHLDAAVDAATAPIDEDLLARVLALAPRCPWWNSGLQENN